MFEAANYHSIMTDTSQLRAATADEIAESLSFGCNSRARREPAARIA